MFKQYGVIRVQDYDELLEVAQLLANQRKPKKRGVAVVSHSGGISSLTADMLGQSGLDLPPLSDNARDGINAILKDFGWAANPADVTGFARSDEFPQIMRLHDRRARSRNAGHRERRRRNAGRARYRPARQHREERRVLLDREPHDKGARTAEGRAHSHFLFARRSSRAD